MIHFACYLFFFFFILTIDILTQVPFNQKKKIPFQYLQQVLPKIGHHSLRQSRHGCENSRQIRRKSAVELLAESKHFYVKSETVLDRKQQLNHRLANHPGRGCSSATSMESNSMSCKMCHSFFFFRCNIFLLLHYMVLCYC